MRPHCIVVALLSAVEFIAIHIHSFGVVSAVVSKEHPIFWKWTVPNNVVDRTARRVALGFGFRAHSVLDVVTILGRIAAHHDWVQRKWNRGFLKIQRMSRLSFFRQS